MICSLLIIGSVSGYSSPAAGTEGVPAEPGTGVPGTRPVAHPGTPDPDRDSPLGAARVPKSLSFWSLSIFDVCYSPRCNSRGFQAGTVTFSSVSSWGVIKAFQDNLHQYLIREMLSNFEF